MPNRSRIMVTVHSAMTPLGISPLDALEGDPEVSSTVVFSRLTFLYSIETAA
jgi:hypothetical protein